MRLRHTFDVGNANNKSDIAPVVAFTIMGPNQLEPLIKLPISIEQDSMQYQTSVLIDSIST